MSISRLASVDFHVGEVGSMGYINTGVLYLLADLVSRPNGPTQYVYPKQYIVRSSYFRKPQGGSLNSSSPLPFSKYDDRIPRTVNRAASTIQTMRLVQNGTIASTQYLHVIYNMGSLCPVAE